MSHCVKSANALLELLDDRDCDDDWDDGEFDDDREDGEDCDLIVDGSD